MAFNEEQFIRDILGATGGKVNIEKGSPLNKSFEEMKKDLEKVFKPREPLFTLTAEEVEVVRFHLAHKKKALDCLLCKIGCDEEKDDDEYRRWESQFNEISYILNKIKEWQDENKDLV